MSTARLEAASPPGGPLAGFTVGVTADRRRDELVALIERRGARVVEAPTMRILPLGDDTVLHSATERCLTGSLDYVVATTGVGWRGWMSAAEGWGTAGRLAEACGRATVISRGPKATGAIRASGLRETHSPASEAIDEVLDWLLARELHGTRIAVQEHGAPLEGFAAALRERGADVIEVPVYRWGPADDPAAVRRLVEQTVRREVHALAFTSAPAIEAFLACAEESGRRDTVLDAMRGDVLPVCIGPICARPLSSRGVETVWPDRGRLGSLVRVLAEELPARSRRELATAWGPVVLQGACVTVGGDTLWLPPLPGAVLRALADRPGAVLSRAELLRRVWTDQQPEEHAVEAAVARLRTALGAYSGLVRTVTKRGYRLVVDV
ncbi:uroporphyrinogen-III synthase [Wenjunlia tyrosinilytica]|uniref:Uroporphyrinogen-III synthase n=1 Tax=Wenjunlia tyrosinilytica TaxID=1544741 RepID=A0A918DUL5_9ACTN|nr:uroporphyrinogen-III synthase [Wenjunlia tyrosinilytica]GGO83891.1 uroporphyrinogen-III synthase [Wenjunlia tyrosinilytica]